MTDMHRAAEKSECQTHSRDDLIDFIEGSTLLATGGGGATQIARNMLDASGITGVTAVALDQAADDVPAAMVAEVFAPSALWAFQDYRSALNSFSQSVGRGLVLSGEVGAVNGIVPAIVAALTGSLLLKCSTSDRSLPEMDMTLFQNTVGLGLVEIVGPCGSPVCSKDFGADSNAMDAETFILDSMNTYAQQFQGVGGFAAYPLTGGQLKAACASGWLFANTFDYALQLGRVMRRQGGLDGVLQTVQDYLGGEYSPYTLFTGYFVEFGLHPHAQDYSYVDFRSDDPESALGLRLYASNENMIAYATLWVMVRGAMTAIELFPVAIGPDAITYLLLEGESAKGYKAGFSFTNEAFDPTYGDPDFFRCNRVAVIGIPEPRLRRSDIIAAFTREITRAMASFDKEYSNSYTPIEDLPKIREDFDIRRTGGAGPDNLTLHLPATAEGRPSWHEGTESAGNANSVRVFGYANMAGKTMQYASAANHGTRPPLTVNWPAMPAQK